MKDKVLEQIEAIFEELKALNIFVYDNPELGYEEFKSSKAHIDILKKHGFVVEEGYLGMQTAFRASYRSSKPGAKIAYLSEYDALPGIGHGCAHNILGTASTGSGIVLSKLIDITGGEVVVFGTPAEETSGGKVKMAEMGAFKEFSAALIAHPAEDNYKSGTSLAMEAIAFKYYGKTSHAASEPHMGINALDACINTFNNINALREHIRTDARVHGIISDGGKAANIVPDFAEARFYVRAATKTYLKELIDKVKRCAEGASIAAGTRLEISNYEEPYDNLVTNNALQDVYTKSLSIMGVDDIKEPRKSYGSLDAGNVSHFCPTIHPYFKITPKDLPGHTTEFRDASITDYAYKSLKHTIGALVLTGLEVLGDEQIRERIIKEFISVTK